jgi:hypothetical protein
MWDKDVLEPRLVAAWGTGEALPEQVRELIAPLDARYGVTFDSCLINLYRDGDDAVAWHGDTVRKVLRDPLVATVSLGARRSFLLKPPPAARWPGGTGRGGRPDRHGRRLPARVAAHGAAGEDRLRSPDEHHAAALPSRADGRLRPQRLARKRYKGVTLRIFRPAVR